MLLLLILVVGPLQAQSVFACSMMDVVMQGDCCCADHKPYQGRADSDCEWVVDTQTSPCCEHSVVVSVDEEARQDTPIMTAAEVRTGVDPPPAIHSPIIEIGQPQQTSASRVDYFPYDVGHSGSDTYLVTQRLRI